MKTSNVLYGLFVATSLLSLLATPSQGASKGALITLHAKWQAAPFLLEAAEYMADEDQDVFWQFVEAWSGSENENKPCWEVLESISTELLSGHEAKVLQVVLGVRQYSARLEMFRSLAEAMGGPQGACCLAKVGPKIVTTASDLAAALNDLSGPDNTTAIYAFDHVYGSKSASQAEGVNAVLYGAFGTKCFAAMHALLSARAADEPETPGKVKVIYAYRPVFLGGCTAEDMGESSCLLMGTGGNLQLPGYGVEMAIKNMEYSALDDSKVKAEKEAAENSGGEEQGPLEVGGFLFKRLLERKPDKQQDLLTFRDHLLASSSQEEALKVWDLKDLGLQATQRIAQSSDPLRMLTEISQNFPNVAGSLSRVVVSKDLRREVSRTHGIFPAGSSYVIINGKSLDTDTLDLYTLLDAIRSEVRLADMLAHTDLQPVDIKSLLQLGNVGAGDGEGAVRVDITSPINIYWANNLERDPEYRGWSRALTSVLRPSFPGQLPRIGLNVYNGIFLLDPGNMEAVFMGAIVHDFVSRMWPVRLGALLLPAAAVARIKDTDTPLVAWDELSTGEKATQAFIFLHNADPAAAFKMFAVLAEKVIPPSGVIHAEDKVKWEDYAAAFTSVWKEIPASKRNPVSAAEALKELEGTTSAQAKMAEDILFAKSRGVASSADALWLNGQLLSQEGNWRQVLMYYIQMEMQKVQEWVYMGTLYEDEDDDVLHSILALTGAVPRYNPRILKNPAAGDKSGPDAPRQLLLARKGLRPSEAPFSGLGYIHHPGSEDDVKGITHWLVADLDTKEGKMLILEALKRIADSRSKVARTAIIFNPSDPERPPSVLAMVLHATCRLTSRRAKVPEYLLSLVHRHLASAGDLTVASALDLAEEMGLNRKALEALTQDGQAGEAVRLHGTACREVLGLSPGAAAVISNGRVFPIFDEKLGVDNFFAAGDFELLEQHSIGAKVAKQVLKVVKAALAGGRAKTTAEEGDIQEDMSPEELSNAAMVAASALYPAPDAAIDARAGKLAKAMQRSKNAYSGMTVAGELAAVELGAVISPLSTAAQRLGPLLQFVQSTLNITVKVFLNPETDLTDMPLKSYYRYALPGFAMKGEHLGAPDLPVAKFDGLPSSKVLTLNMDVPEAWLVEPVSAPYDLDNLRLEDLGSVRYLEAGFELEALMITGQCMDVAAKSREQVNPRGVQLYLGTGEKEHVVDTLVMANLGYFQLKAAPGLWQLRLAPGRTQKLYTIASATGLSGAARTGADEVGTEADELSTPVVVSRLDGKHMFLRLRKRPGFEDEDVLDEANVTQTGTLWGKVSSLLKPSDGGKQLAKEGGALSPEDDPECIHIFTIASGHMYERLQKLMIVSVLRNTKNRVKFWFIKNYMSPQMKRFVPLMAKSYGFDYEFVTYKWPSWLHKQTEKQRIIWAYKILFLDVLFPLSLKRVIFADSDQIIRADFADLWHMDLQGAPYAYTPFCDNNKDMDGFRFWNQGFWKEHLHGKPYHISALYMVDLARFRQMAAGDQLRVIYSQLSQDPHSLANLDQDLPNYAQRMVPIFTLPQEWLWCETWCGNSTKAAAKTIDLCNNPLTKEPKLEAARRIVSEWTGLDEEIQNFTEQAEEELEGNPWGPGGDVDVKVADERPSRPLPVAPDPEMAVENSVSTSRHDVTEL